MNRNILFRLLFSVFGFMLNGLSHAAPAPVGEVIETNVSSSAVELKLSGGALLELTC